MPVSPSELALHGEIASMKPGQLLKCATEISKAIQPATQENDEDAFAYYARAIALFDAYLNAVEQAPEWVGRVFARQLRDGALVCERLAARSKEADLALATRYWTQGAQWLQHLLDRSPDASQAKALLARMSRSAATACDQLASALKDKDTTQSTDYRIQSALLLSALFSRVPEQPVSMSNIYIRQTRNAAIACDQIGSQLKDTDAAKALAYWTQGTQLLEHMLSRYPEQPAQIGMLLARQVRNSAAICDRLASSLREGHAEQAAQYWTLGAQLLEKLIAEFPEQPPAIKALHDRHVRNSKLALKKNLPEQANGV